MKKLYFLLTALIVSIAANAADQLWLVGESPLGNGWNPTSGIAMTPTGEAGVFSISVKTTANKYFAFVDQLGANSSDWGTFNSHRYGPSNGGAVAKEGDNQMIYGQDRSFQIPAGEYTFIVNTNTKVLNVSGPVVEAPLELWIRGDMNNWNCSDLYKFATTDHVNFTLTLDEIGTQAFKLGSAQWEKSYSSVNTAMVANQEYTCEEGGMDNNMAFAAPLTNVTLTFNANTRVFKAVGVTGEVTYPETLYLLGTTEGNGWDPTKGVAMPSIGKGIYEVTATFVDMNNNIGFSFTEKLATSAGDWEGLGQRYGSTEGENFTPSFTAPNSLGTNGNNSFALNVAGDYKINVNLVEMQMTISPVNGNAYPTTMYVIGQVNGKDWGYDNGVALNATETDGVFTGEFQLGNSGDGYGFFSFTTALGTTDWSDMGTRYGATESDYVVTLGQPMGIGYVADNAFKATGDTKYAVTVDLTKMEVTVTEAEETPDPTPGETEDFSTTYNFTSFDDMSTYLDLPGVDQWSSESTAGHKSYSIEGKDMVSEGVTMVAAGGGTKLYYTGSAYSLRLYNGTTLTVTAPAGGKLNTFKIDASSGTSATMGKTTATNGTLTSGTKLLEWTAPEEGVSSVTFTFGGTIAVSTITVTGEKPAESDEPTPEPEYSYYLNGGIFYQGYATEVEMTVLDGVARAEAKCWPQSFNIVKKNGEEVVATYGPETTENAANEITSWNPIQATESSLNWVLSAVLADPNGKDLTFSFNIDTLVLTITETTGIEGVEVDSTVPARYFNLQGVEVVNPNAGIYIEVRGKEVRKVRF